MPVWNPWHGCRKFSEGCDHCYVYRRDATIGKDASVVRKTKSFGDPVKRKRGGDFKLPGGVLWACMTSDFFIEEADAWRKDVWEMIAARTDIFFHIITKRIVRATECLPPDWGAGYENVRFGCTVESDKQAAPRLGAFREFPAKGKFIICEPLLGKIDLSPHLGEWVDSVVVGGESGDDARECRYDWVLDLREQCIASETTFRFKQTGAHFVKDGRRYRVARRLQESQARKADIDVEF
jgi:protein gp37